MEDSDSDADFDAGPDDAGPDDAGDTDAGDGEPPSDRVRCDVEVDGNTHCFDAPVDDSPHFEIWCDDFSGEDGPSSSYSDDMGCNACDHDVSCLVDVDADTIDDAHSFSLPTDGGVGPVVLGFGCTLRRRVRLIQWRVCAD